MIELVYRTEQHISMYNVFRQQFIPIEENWKQLKIEVSSYQMRRLLVKSFFVFFNFLIFEMIHLCIYRSIVKSSSIFAKTKNTHRKTRK